MPQTFEDAICSHYLIERWGNFIQTQKWQWFCHLTFKDDPSEAAAHKAFMRWIGDLNRHEYGRRYYRTPGGPQVTWIRSTEWQERGSLHYHVVVGNHSLDPALGKKLWKGNSKVVAYDVNRGGAFYLAKRFSNIDVSNNLVALRPH